MILIRRIFFSHVSNPMDDGPLLNEDAKNPPVLVQIVSPGSFPERLALGSPNYSLMDSSMSF